MSIDDLWTADGPTPAVLKQLERFARRREAIARSAAARVGDPDVARVVDRAHAVLDDLEEALCEEGARSPALARGLEALRRLEDRLAELTADPTADPTAETSAA